jgi:hypothetical protein
VTGSTDGIDRRPARKRCPDATLDDVHRHGHDAAATQGFHGAHITGGAEMTWSAGAQLQHVDRILNRLSEHRHRCEDPREIVRTTESIDHWLDQRLVLARRIERDQAVSAEAARRNGTP